MGVSVEGLEKFLEALYEAEAVDRIFMAPSSMAVMFNNLMAPISGYAESPSGSYRLEINNFNFQDKPIAIAVIKSYLNLFRHVPGSQNQSYDALMQYLDVIESVYGIKGINYKSGGCFIATAAYGTTLVDDVRYLRSFRDKSLLTSGSGRAFVRFYYRYSPRIADAIAGDETRRRIVRDLFIRPLVKSLKFVRSNGEE